MTYDPSWDRPHTPGPEDLWQESDCWWFMDLEQKVGGMQRLGQTPNIGKSHIMSFCFAADGERYLGHRDGKPGDAERWADGQRIESHRVEALDNQRMLYSWDDPESSAELEFYECFYAPRDWTEAPPEAVMKDMNTGGHSECSGRVKGTVRIGAKTYKIDALAHRDRSWGYRDWSTAGQSKMHTGTIGPEMSWAAFIFQRRDTGEWFDAGYVVRDGKQEDIANLRMIASYDTDSFTGMGGRSIITLKSGEKIVIPSKPMQAYLSQFDNFVATTNMSTADINGKVGMSIFELLTNPGLGPMRYPKQSQLSYICAEHGLSKSAVYEE
ncbi:hypothetical protein POM99_20935 [Novosphingobium sp. HBC54]|uniref:AttH domain-containing protein n=1 Tax=Novosphingobium cyanobacteriorum TaxID=3024215 RepID=A0ABT6CPZ3_9SPHN|nr:hypothetical protein [Novosphingobium cyanobacteriorum]MDF8335678.1 hypothetical protein [Novosphingobium cyanobacteriorum]